VIYLDTSVALAQLDPAVLARALQPFPARSGPGRDLACHPASAELVLPVDRIT